MKWKPILGAYLGANAGLYLYQSQNTAAGQTQPSIVTNLTNPTAAVTAITSALSAGNYMGLAYIAGGALLGWHLGNKM